MTTVNIAELKNRLSHYLRQVREGDEILIRDRNRPVAKIVPLSETDDLAAEELALAAAGKLRLGQEPLRLSSFLSLPRGRTSLTRAAKVVEDEREEHERGLLGH